MKVALFGSSGLLGSAISKELDKRSFEVIKYHRSQESGERHADLKRINLMDHEHLIRELFDIWPDAIVRNFFTDLVSGHNQRHRSFNFLIVLFQNEGG